MWRGILIIMISFAWFLNVGVNASDVAKEDQCYDIIKSIAPNALINEDGKISRGDCVSIIMKLIGVDREIAKIYGNGFYDQPVFEDVNGGGENDGYIIIAKFSGVARGVDKAPNGVNNFAPNRDVNVKECLAFMLRCVKNSNDVGWDNILTDSVQIGLLRKDELNIFVADAPLLNKEFCTLLYRMLNMNRYLYWPAEEPQAGYAKSMQIDQTGSLKYIDWILEMYNE